MQAEAMSERDDTRARPNGAAGPAGQPPPAGDTGGHRTARRRAWLRPLLIVLAFMGFGGMLYGYARDGVLDKVDMFAGVFGLLVTFLFLRSSDDGGEGK
jgi:hypothetical protein